MSIPMVADSAASRLLQIVDGGFECNTPYYIMPASTSSIVLSHFRPMASYPESIDRLPLYWLSRGPIRHGYRLLWAYVNTTFPHVSDQCCAEWIYSGYGGLNFFSRSLARHREAIRQGVEDMEKWLAGRSPLQLHPANMTTQVTS